MPALRAENIPPHVSKALEGLARWLRSHDADACLYLVGSHARDDWLYDSDLDLVAVSKIFSGLNIGERFSIIKSHMEPGYSLDLLAYTPEEFKEALERSIILQDMMENSIKLV